MLACWCILGKRPMKHFCKIKNLLKETEADAFSVGQSFRWNTWVTAGLKTEIVKNGGCSASLQRSLSLSLLLSLSLSLFYSHTQFGLRELQTVEFVIFKCNSRHPWPLRSTSNQTCDRARSDTCRLQRQVFEFIMLKKNGLHSCPGCSDGDGSLHRGTAPPRR